MTNYRKTKLYKKLNAYLACALAEGFCEGEGASEEDQLTAWQWLVDTGTCWHLVGWYGRTAVDLIKGKVIQRPIESHKDYWANTVPGTK